MLGLGLILFRLRALRPGLAWKERPLAIAFWSINIGLAAMVVFSMLPVGLMQAWASFEYGTWHARIGRIPPDSSVNTSTLDEDVR